MKKIVIFGIGLIGGSIALKVKQKKLYGQVTGVGRDGGSSLKKLVSKGMLDSASENLMEDINAAEIIIIATPVAQTKKILGSIYPYLHKNTVITDVGSTKTNVMHDASEVLKEKSQQFIGSHPIAGSEKHGPNAAISDLFENKDIVVTPHSKSPKEFITLIEKFWLSLGGKVSIMDPNLHDQIFSTVSHLPHLLAFGLVNLINKKANKKQLLDFAASGFRDFSRIAASSPEVWRDISLGNKDAILSDLQLYKQEIDAVINLIEGNDILKLDQYLAKASSTRTDWNES